MGSNPTAPVEKVRKQARFRRFEACFFFNLFGIFPQFSHGFFKIVFFTKIVYTLILNKITMHIIKLLEYNSIKENFSKTEIKYEKNSDRLNW